MENAFRGLAAPIIIRTAQRRVRCRMLLEGGDQAKAQRYLPDLVDLHAGIALGTHTDATLHTRAYSARELRELAMGAPPTVPMAPPPHDEDDGGDGLA